MKSADAVHSMTRGMLPLIGAALVLLGVLVVGGRSLQRVSRVEVRPPSVAPVAVRVAQGVSRGSPAYLDGIMRRNIFDEDVIAAWSPADAEAGPVAATLDVTLLGTVVTEQPQLSTAFIRHEDGTTRFYGLGQEVAGYQIASIEQRRVTLVAPNGREAVLETSDQGSLQPNQPSTASSRSVTEAPSPSTGDEQDPINVDGRLLSRMDLDKLVRERRFIPEVAPDGTVAGLRARDIRPGTVPHRLGLKDGDVLMAIEGQRFDDMNAVGKLVRQLGSRDAFCAEVERGGAPRLLCYTVH